MSKRTKTQQIAIWKKCVKEARAQLKKRNDLKLGIAKLAIEACDIRHGGGAHWSEFKNIYTASKFADDIGLHRKTLFTWIEVETEIGDQVELMHDKPWRIIQDAARKIKRDGAKTKEQKRKIIDSFVYEEKHRRRERLLMSYLSPLYKNLKKDEKLKLTKREYQDCREMLIESLAMLDKHMKPTVRIRKKA